MTFLNTKLNCMAVNTTSRAKTRVKSRKAYFNLAHTLGSLTARLGPIVAYLSDLRTLCS